MINTQSYNTIIRIAGNEVTLKRLNKYFVFGYDTKNKNDSVRGKSEFLEDNFNRSTNRARQKVFDLVNANVNRHPTPTGEYPTTKFVTLTFAENVVDYDYAVREFTNFNKRLSYALFKVRKNVLKYIAVPEYQERGAIHFHIIYFNLPYVDFDLLSYTWFKGYVFINKVRDDITNYAKYIAKYMTKSNKEGKSQFEIYKENNLINKRRYYTSKGLIRPMDFKLNIDSELLSTLMNKLAPYKTGEYDTSGEFFRINNDYYSLPTDILKDKFFELLNHAVEEHLNKFRVPII